MKFEKEIKIWLINKVIFLLLLDFESDWEIFVVDLKNIIKLFKC